MLDELVGRGVGLRQDDVDQAVDGGRGADPKERSAARVPGALQWSGRHSARPARPSMAPCPARRGTRPGLLRPPKLRTAKAGPGAVDPLDQILDLLLEVTGDLVVQIPIELSAAGKGPPAERQYVQPPFEVHGRLRSRVATPGPDRAAW